MNTTCNSPISTVARPRFQISTLLIWVRSAIKARRERRQLATLDSRALADIGVSASEAQHESTRPIWDLPHNRDFRI